MGRQPGRGGKKKACAHPLRGAARRARGYVGARSEGRHAGAMDDLVELARAFLDRRTAVAVLSTVDARGRSDACVLAAARFTQDGLVAGGEEEGVSGAAFRN